MYTYFVLAAAVVRNEFWKAPSKDISFGSPHSLYAVLNYCYALFPLTLALAYYCCRPKVLLATVSLTIRSGTVKLTRSTSYYGLAVSTNGDWDWTTVIYFLVNLFFNLTQLPPYANTIGLCLPSRPYQYSQKPRRRSFRTMNVCLVTKGTNFQVILSNSARSDLC